jgi:YgiT-type zinc finger domain-containing protein
VDGGVTVFFDCEGCGGTVVGTAVTVEEQLLVGGRHLVVRDVPADACDSCGELRTTAEVEAVLAEAARTFGAGRLVSPVRFATDGVFGQQHAA